MTKVVITGATGFLGSELVAYFAAEGWQVTGLCRTPKKSKNLHVTYKAYDMMGDVDENIFKDADYLVHTAFIKYDQKHPDAFQLNVAAAQKLLATAKKHKLKKPLFISSMSAHAGAVSVYGKQKLAVEKLFVKDGGVALRSGMIIGNGGIVAQMVDFMRSKHMVPLIGGGKQPLQIIGVYDLVKAIDKSLTLKNVTGVLTVATPQVYTYKSFYQSIARRLGIRVFFVPVPFWLLLNTMRLISYLHIPLAVNEDNLLGLKMLKAAKTSDDLSRLHMTVDGLEKALSNVNLTK